MSQIDRACHACASAPSYQHPTKFYLSSIPDSRVYLLYFVKPCSSVLTFDHKRTNTKTEGNKSPVSRSVLFCQQSSILFSRGPHPRWWLKTSPPATADTLHCVGRFTSLAYASQPHKITNENSETVHVYISRVLVKTYLKQFALLVFHMEQRYKLCWH
jgi:hypothetical protein